MKHNTKHGGPYDRGGMDRYYGRQFTPHYYADNGNGGQSKVFDLSAEQIAAYRAGYNGQDDRKDYGAPCVSNTTDSNKEHSTMHFGGGGSL